LGCTSRTLTSLVDRWCAEHGHRIDWLVTRGPGDATSLARTALHNGAETVISVGGDGTHNEVVNAWFDGSGNPINAGASLGVIDCGTGSDLRKSLGIGRRIEDSLSGLQSGTTADIDVGVVAFVDHTGAPAQRHFLNVASLGLSGVVDKHIARSRLRWAGGRAAFAVATARSFLDYRNTVISVALDGGQPEEQLVCALAAANGRYFGGGMKVAPEALLDDGLLDVVCLGDFHLHDFLLRGHHLYRGTHLNLEKVWHRRAGTVAVTCECGTQVLLDVDGETPGRLPATIRIMPSALRVLVGNSVCLTLS